MQALIAALALMVAPLSRDSALPDAPAPAAIAQPEKPAEKKEPAKKEPDAKQPEKKGEKPPPADPATEDVLKDMEKERGNPPTPSTAPPATTPAPAQAEASKPAAAAKPQSARLLREGTFLVERRGRMVRTPNGDWTYVFDADAQGQSDPAMTLLPCQRLEAMEKLAERYGESMTLVVTGQVFAYRNRNYLLPATFKVLRQNQDIKSTQ